MELTKAEREFFRKTAVAILAVVLVSVSAVGLLLFHLGRTMQRRIVPDGPGALMALDTDGLRELYVLYASPTICGDLNYQKSSDFITRQGLCGRAVTITPGTVKKGLVLLPGGTRGVSLRTGYILAGGHLAASSYSPLTLNQALKDGAVKVEYVRFSQPPDRNVEGWLAAGHLQCDCGPFL